MVRPGRTVVATALSAAAAVLVLLVVPLPASPMGALLTSTLLPMTVGALCCFGLVRDEPWTVVVGLSAVVAAVPVLLGVVARSSAGVSAMLTGSIITGVLMAAVHAGVVLGLGAAMNGLGDRSLSRL